ncbi:MAG: hypothetical protein FJ298_04295 [Planctomycetes bacterium]|nr:hypothetical protein [Planctomycetota bacterium]
MRATFVCGLLFLAGCADEPRSTPTREDSRSHVAIAGTRVALAPPSGFEPSERVRGLERAEGKAKIGVFELTASYAEALRNAHESWAASGMELTGEESIALDGRAGTLVEYRRMERGAARGGWLAIGGDERETLLLLAECDASAVGELATALRACLLGVRWQRPGSSLASFELHPAEGLVLVSDDERGKAYVAASAPSPVPAGTPFLLANAHSDSLAREALESSCTQRLSAALDTVGASVASIERSGRVELGSLGGWELVARVRDPRQPGDWLGYAALVPLARGHLLLLGHASPTESRTALELFERTARTLRLR